MNYQDFFGFCVSIRLLQAKPAKGTRTVSPFRQRSGWRSPCHTGWPPGAHFLSQDSI